MPRPSLLILMALLLTNCSDDNPTFVYDETTAIHPHFSGEKAFTHLEKIVAIGPRVAGSEGLKKSRQYIVAQLEQFGWGVKIENHKRDTPIGEIEFYNIRARYSPTEKPAIWDSGVTGILCSHYDTKKFSFEFVGANDGGSSTAALIEIARVLAQKPDLAREIELVWFDGEEAFRTNITEADGLYGSKIYATQLALLPKAKRPKWGLLLDMIGDKNLNIQAYAEVEQPSLIARKNTDPKLPKIDFAKLRDRRFEIADHLIKASDHLGHQRKFSISSSYITDDHVPLNNIAGIPTIDIIDFEFDYWHTPGDNLDKVSPESLEIVGQTTLLTVEKFLMSPQ